MIWFGWGSCEVLLYNRCVVYSVMLDSERFDFVMVSLFESVGGEGVFGVCWGLYLLCQCSVLLQIVCIMELNGCCFSGEFMLVSVGCVLCVNGMY